MGQKTNPIGNQTRNTSEDGILTGMAEDNYGDKIAEDSQIRQYIGATSSIKLVLPEVVIERTLKTDHHYHSLPLRPGIIIGKGGSRSR